MKLISETGRQVFDTIDERGKYKINRLTLETGERLMIPIVYRIRLTLVALSKSISQKLYNTEMVLTKYIRKVVE